MKEQINPQENKKILLHQKLQKLDEVNKYWDKIGLNFDMKQSVENSETEETELSETDVRTMEDYVVGDLLLTDFKREDLSEDDLAVINEYLSNGDNVDLMEKVADKFGIEYRSPFDQKPTHDSKAEEQILKEIESEKNYN